MVDGLVVTSDGLEVDESLLTGEADPVPKPHAAEVLSGSFVSAGSGVFKARRVGPNAYAARLYFLRGPLMDGNVAREHMSACSARSHGHGAPSSFRNEARARAGESAGALASRA